MSYFLKLMLVVIGVSCILLLPQVALRGWQMTRLLCCTAILLALFTFDHNPNFPVSSLKG